jgi:hypothetical protein
VFERFTDRACSAVVWAERDAVELGHRRVGTEHLLLGLAHDDESVGGRTLRSLGVTYDEARRRVEALAPREAARANRHVPFSGSAKQLLELSLRSALRQDHHRIGTSDLTLSLFGMNTSTALRILDGLGIDPAHARTRVLEMLTNERAASHTPRISGLPSLRVELSPQAQELALRALRMGSSYVAGRYPSARLVQHATKGARLFRILNVGPILSQQLAPRADIPGVPTSPPSVRAGCSVCGTLSPACGTLYTSAYGVLTCERCARDADDKPRSGG